ncbi:MAG: hypothetical protein UHO61_00805 [Acutalibacteraceae bacterium]|nr:hypothetical protein [Acutalibacteraceae bacterium]
MENFDFKYFLAANSCEEFCSYFDKNYLPNGEWRAFIIKGGPGTGKSSFMKYFALKASEKGYKTVLCPCSSDPNSLDGVILPQKKLVILDGTPPHTIEPAFPGACEKILNFGDFWDDNAFKADKKEIIATSLLNKAYHKTASRYIEAAGKLILDSYKTAIACTDKEKALQFSKNLCRKLIPQKANAPVGNEWIRFVEGITPLGIVSYSDTVLKEVPKALIINDEYGAASNIIIGFVREYALKNGYEIITLKNPFLPSLITDHIIIPELGLAIATENAYIHFSANERRIHARRFTSSQKLHLSRERLKFNKKAAKELLLSAAGTLDGAKRVHDKLESYYIKAMDFRKLTAFAEKFTEETL